MEPTPIPSAQGMHLRRLRDLENFEVADDSVDVRGWAVRGSDGKKFGDVFELIVDEDAMKVRYLDIELDASLQIDKWARHILLPIGVATIDEDGDNIFVPSLNLQSVLEYPPYTEVLITREYEEAMLRSLKLPLPEHASTPFYEQAPYSEQHFYQNRRPTEPASSLRRRIG